MADPDFDLSTHSNDAYFKEVFSKPERAAALFQNHLPAPVAEVMDWTTLRLAPSSFVKTTLRQTHSDLLYSVQAQECEVLLYLLFEHQTAVDPAMPLRLLGYMHDIWRVHEQQNGLPLPPVLPFVLHQGPETWTVSAQFTDMFQLSAKVAPLLLPFLPDFKHALLDLTKFDPAIEEHHVQLRVVLQLMKMARQKRLLEFFEWLAAELVDRLLPESLLRVSLYYALHADSRLDVEQIYHTLESNPSLKEQAMSVAQQLIAQGEARGEARGQAQGEARGEARGRLKALQEMMGLPVSSSEELAGLTVAELDQRFDLLQQEYKAKFKGL